MKKLHGASVNLSENLARDIDFILSCAMVEGKPNRMPLLQAGKQLIAALDYGGGKRELYVCKNVDDMRSVWETHVYGGQSFSLGWHIIDKK